MMSIKMKTIASRETRVVLLCSFSATSLCFVFTANDSQDAARSKAQSTARLRVHRTLLLAPTGRQDYNAKSSLPDIGCNLSAGTVNLRFTTENQLSPCFL
jgi:hypothetical protein